MDLNCLAILVAAVANMILGALWYRPIFGKKWMAYMGFTPESIEAQKQGMGAKYFVAFVGSLIMVFILAVFLRAFGGQGAYFGAIIGSLAWLGFVATVTLGSVLWEGKPWGLWTLNNAYQLLGLVVSGIILSLWV